MFEVDKIAKERAIKLGMPPDVHIPIAARNREAILKYIGSIENIKTIPGESAFVVIPFFYPEQNKKLPLWKLKESIVLHNKKQVWVHVNYKSYRTAFIKACPEINVKGYVLDHILNRRIARLKRFEYLRIIPVTKAVNTSSGGVTEKYGFGYHNTERMKNINQQNEACIEYADIADIVKMLNYKTGGKLQDIVRDSMNLLIEE